MTVNKSIISLFLCLLPLFAYCQDDYVFSDSLIAEYEEAVELNSKKDYLTAYNRLLSVEKEIDKELSEHNTTVARLDDSDFRTVYWPVKKSLAEVAYMLGNHVVTLRIANELSRARLYRTFKGDDAATLNGYRSDVEKIIADYNYLIGNNYTALKSLRNALFYGPNDSEGSDFRSKIFADIAQVYYKMHVYALALNNLDSVLACKYYNENGRNWSLTKESEVMEYHSQRAITLARLKKFDEALKEIEPVLKYFKRQKNDRSYGEALRKKAKILMLQYDATGEYNPSSKKCYEGYLAVARLYVDAHFTRMSESEREQYWMAEQPFVTDCYRLEDKAPELLFDVALYSKAVLLQMGRKFTSSMTVQQRSKALASIRTTWQQVQKKLPEEATAIEFIAYEKNDKKSIGALVLGKKGKPVFLPLFYTDKFLGTYLSGDMRVRDALNNTSKESANALYNSPQVKNLIWNEQLVKLIGNSKKIYFSPDGIFHQIAIEYLLPDNLSGKDFYRMTSTRMLTEPHKKVRTDNMLMSGFINYHSEQPMADKAGNDELAYSLMSSYHMELSTLYNSQSEIDSVLSTRSKLNHDTVLSWNVATEYAVRQLLPKYHIALLSTHGMFSDAENAGTDIRPAITDTQLSKSCLFFAGAVTNMNNSSFDASNLDGILSARELSSMNLQNVDLAMLSACQTGLGYITPDGVYGLQRGMKAAGVKAVIASLWSVNDKATSVLTHFLFSNLSKGMELHAAFNKARQQLREYCMTFDFYGLLKRKITFNEPFFYDSFILIDGQE